MIVVVQRSKTDLRYLTGRLGLCRLSMAWMESVWCFLLCFRKVRFTLAKEKIRR